jgi:hypothetical protein
MKDGEKKIELQKPPDLGGRERENINLPCAARRNRGFLRFRQNNFRCYFEFQTSLSFSVKLNTLTLPLSLWERE